MGQQQIILLLLVAVIVGLSAVIAVNTMTESHQSANEEAIRLKLLEAHSVANSYYHKNASLGGGGKSFEEITLQDLLLDSVMTEGEFAISGRNRSRFEITVQPISGAEDISASISESGITFTNN